MTLWGGKRERAEVTPLRATLDCPLGHQPHKVLGSDLKHWLRGDGLLLVEYRCPEDLITVWQKISDTGSVALASAGYPARLLAGTVPELLEVHDGPRLTRDDELAWHNELEITQGPTQL